MSSFGGVLQDFWLQELNTCFIEHLLVAAFFFYIFFSGGFEGAEAWVKF